MSKFDLKAKEWDTKDKIYRSETIANSIKQNINLKKDENVLDFGCGTGLLSYALIDSVGSIKCIDLYQNMLNELEKKNINSKNITIELKGIFEVDSKYDLIISSMVMHHIEGTSKLAKKLFTSLNIGGEIAIADLMTEDGRFHSYLEGVFYKGFSEESLFKTFKSAGFSNIKVIKNIFVIENKGRKYPLFLLTAKKS